MALSYLGHQYRSVVLAPVFCFVLMAERKTLYRAFAAASIPRVRILQDAQRVVTSLPPQISDGTRHSFNITKEQLPHLHFQWDGQYPAFWIPRSTESIATSCPTGASTRLARWIPAKLFL